MSFLLPIYKVAELIKLKVACCTYPLIYSIGLKLGNLNELIVSYFNANSSLSFTFLANDMLKIMPHTTYHVLKRILSISNFVVGIDLLWPN